MDHVRALLEEVQSGRSSFGPASDSDEDVQAFQPVAKALKFAESQGFFEAPLLIEKTSRSDSGCYILVIVRSGLSHAGAARVQALPAAGANGADEASAGVAEGHTRSRTSHGPGEDLTKYDRVVRRFKNSWVGVVLLAVLASLSAISAIHRPFADIFATKGDSSDPGVSDTKSDLIVLLPSSAATCQKKLFEFEVPQRKQAADPLPAFSGAMRVEGVFPDAAACDVDGATLSYDCDWGQAGAPPAWVPAGKMSITPVGPDLRSSGSIPLQGFRDGRNAVVASGAYCQVQVCAHYLSGQEVCQYEEFTLK